GGSSGETPTLIAAPETHLTRKETALNSTQKRVFQPIFISFILAMTAVVISVPVAHSAYPGANGKIAFSSTRSGPALIWLMNSDGSSPFSLPGTGNNYDATW